LGERIPLIIDGGPSLVGIESSVLDLASSPPRLLRPGMISVESLQAVLGECALEVEGAPTAIARSPGQLPRHYAPKAKLVVLRWRDDADLADQVAAFGVARERIHVLSRHRISSREGFGHVAIMPAEAQGYAQALYAELHRCDDAGAELIIVQAPPVEEEWRAIADRLRRAAHGNT
jgi:L-threonylcarbamoyladenylate synthase